MHELFKLPPGIFEDDKDADGFDATPGGSRHATGEKEQKEEKRGEGTPECVIVGAETGRGYDRNHLETAVAEGIGQGVVVESPEAKRHDENAYCNQ